ncbi:MAG TPA: LPS export ABC transporter permease LptG [Rhizomicrobium sp.]|jgi:lipopolysaccharide export system permease protein
MSWSWTLHQYLARQFMAGVGGVFGALCFLTFSIDIVDLLNRTAQRHVPTPAVVAMGLLQLPDLALKLLPFAVLLGGIFSFVRLSRSHELLAIRAAGISAWNLLIAPLTVALGLGLFAVLIFTPFSARMLVEFSQMEARLIRGQASQLAISTNGLWLRQGDQDAQSVIHAQRVADQGVRLEDVNVFLYDPGDSFAGRIDARSAVLGRGAWLLNDAWVSGASGGLRHVTQYALKTRLTPTRIQESFAPPDTLSFWALPGFIDTARQAGFSATRYLLYFDSLLMLPAMFAAMVLMAASFSLRLARLGGLGRIVVWGALAGFGVYFVSAITRALGETGILPIPLAAAAPAIAAILLGMTLVFHHEDG